MSEIKYVRRVQGITESHRIKNDGIRVEELQIESVIVFMERRQLRW